MYEDHGGNAITMLKKDISVDRMSEKINSAYSYREKAKWPWLQKNLFSILDYLGAYHYATSSVETVTYTDIRNDSLIEKVIQHQDEYFKRGYTEELVVVMGYPTWVKLVHGELSAHAPTSFAYSLVDRYKGHRRMCDMKVVVVDLMEGVVVIPRKDL